MSEFKDWNHPDRVKERIERLKARKPSPREQYPSAPQGPERLEWVRARNEAIQTNYKPKSKGS